LQLGLPGFEREKRKRDLLGHVEYNYVCRLEVVLGLGLAVDAGSELRRGTVRRSSGCNQRTKAIRVARPEASRCVGNLAHCWGVL